MNDEPRLGPLVAAGTTLGVGLGGFLDGIVFHQVLQWHAMLSAWRPPLTLLDKQVNTFWDGLFHAFTWLTTVVGIGLLWRARGRRDVSRSGKAFVGSLLLGWGLFNVIEGVIDHHVLNLHNVVEDPATMTAWNLGFLVASVGLIAAGWALIRTGRARAAVEPAAGPRPLPAFTRR